MSKFVLFCFLAIRIYATAEKLNLTSPIPSMITATVPTNKTRLSLPFIFTFSGAIYPLGPICAEPIKIALDALQKSPVLNRYELVVEPIDDMCMRYIGVRYNIDVMSGNINIARPNFGKNRVPLVIGPSCNVMLFTGTHLKYYNHVALSPIADPPDIYNRRSVYDHHFALGMSVEISQYAIPPFLQDNGWSTVYLLSETYGHFAQEEKVLAENLENLNITLAGTSKVLILPSILPTQDRFEIAVRDMAAFNPRIIVINTSYGATIACWLYRYKLFGPDFVLIIYGFSYFQPNDRLRPPDCTERMVFEVLKSVIFFFQGMPINMEGDGYVDQFGTSPRYLEETLKTRINHPDYDTIWFAFRSICYDSVIGAAVALNSVETTLQKDNDDTLANWVASSDNFKTNGTYIASLLKGSLEKLQFKGLTVSENMKPNARTGVTGFWQMQLVTDRTPDLPLSQQIKPILIASYNSSEQNPKLKRGPYKAIWSTQDGQVPYDSVRIIPVKEPIIDPTANWAVKGIAAAILVAILALFVASVVKGRSGGFAKSMPKMNSIILLGNALMLTFVLILPGDGDPGVLASYCMAASFPLLAGFTLVTGAVLAKMEVARLLFKMTVRAKANMSRKRMSRMSTVSSISQSQVLANKIAMLYPRCHQHAVIDTMLWAALQTLVLAIWFGIEPIQSVRLDRNLELSTKSLSLASQHFTYACSLNLESTVGVVLISALIASYGIVFLRSVILAFVLRTAKLAEISDLHFVRFVSYAIGIAGFAGGVAIYVFFAKEPGSLELSVSILAIGIVIINVAAIFMTKLYRLLPIGHGQQHTTQAPSSRN